MRILPDGRTEGRLIIPSAVTGEAPVDADLAGVWIEVRDTVSIGGQQAPSFLKDLPFAVSKDRLVGRRIIGGSLVTVVLERSSH